MSWVEKIIMGPLSLSRNAAVNLLFSAKSGSPVLLRTPDFRHTHLSNVDREQVTTGNRASEDLKHSASEYLKRSASDLAKRDMSTWRDVTLTFDDNLAEADKADKFLNLSRTKTFASYMS